MKAVFFGDSENIFSNRHFHGLADAAVRVAAVVDAPKQNWRSTNTSGPGSLEPFTEWAAGRNITVIRGENPNGEKIVNDLGKLRPDMFIAAGYNRLLKEKLLAIPRLGAVNFHASLLPAYRGKHPLYWALRNGEPLVGLTVHRMDPGLDTGDILYQIKVPVKKGDTVADLYSRIMEKSVPLVGRLIDDAAAGNIEGTPQDEYPWTPSYYSSIPGEDAT